MKNLVVLGSSGSIGKNALWVAERFPEELEVFGLSVRSNLRTLASQVERYRPRLICVTDEVAAAEFKPQAEKFKVELVAGDAGLEALAGHREADIVLNAVVGFAGLRATLAAGQAGKRIALANKESLVAGGQLVMEAAKDASAEIIPVDSEHSAIFQCLKSGRRDEVRRLILTSSGGPFRDLPRERFSEVTVEQALEHPTWRMGRKITIDCATLMNKALEIIEAVHLFDLASDKVEVLIHPQSVVHSMVKFVDGSIVAQLSKPDMRLPIQYSLTYPSRRPLNAADLDFRERLSLDFRRPDEQKFPSINLARKAIEMGGTAPAVMNAANEIAVESFLNRQIRLPRIFEVVAFALENVRTSESLTIDSVVEADRSAREVARRFIGEVSN